MELIDTHAHLTFEELEGDIDGVLSRSRLTGVRSWITVGTDTASNRKTVALAERYADMYAAVGIHPHYAKDAGEDDLALLKEFARSDKVVAIGETGLDFHYNFSKQDRQIEVFRKELETGIELGLPVIIHSRNAFDETVGILDEYAGRLKGVVFHCYSGTAEQAELVLDRGWYISFTGVVTFKNAEECRRAAAVVPVDRMMIETDCPYMSPAPVRNIKPCEPGLLVHTAAKIAEVKGMEIDVFARGVTATSREFFGIE